MLLSKVLRVCLLPIALLMIAGCTAEPTWAPEDQVQRALYTHGGAPTLTLITVIRNRDNQGAHSGLLVNGSHRAIFDPAGSFHHPQLPERNDVHYGITPKALDFYIDYHARQTFRVVTQEVDVSPEQAALALKLIQEYGAVPKAACTSSITRILRQIPGFESIPSSLFPNAAMRSFAKIPGVRTNTIYDDSPDRRGDTIAAPRIR